MLLYENVVIQEQFLLPLKGRPIVELNQRNKCIPRAVTLFGQEDIV